MVKKSEKQHTYLKKNRVNQILVLVSIFFLIAIIQLYVSLFSYSKIPSFEHLENKVGVIDRVETNEYRARVWLVGDSNIYLFPSNWVDNPEVLGDLKIGRSINLDFEPRDETGLQSEGPAFMMVSNAAIDKNLFWPYVVVKESRERIYKYNLYIGLVFLFLGVAFLGYISVAKEKCKR